MRTARSHLAPAGIAAVLALTVSATAPAAAEAATTVRPVAAPGAAAAPSVQASHASARDRAYLRQAHRGNLAEIAAGKAALRRSHDKDVREIAWGLIRDHRKLDARLREVAQRLRVDLPDAPAAEQRDDLDAVLARRSGHRFDRAWLRLQADAHEQTLTLIRRELRHGHSGSVRNLARDGAPVVRHHLDEVRAELTRHAR
ncbi:DUF4142 domain-containing protein [Nonomuraea spiralis]|uniref:DUF4142 domain-containing protein n=1 Tax=Nonomuraea spiralis TaxID=46182 RepID=A0ABV5I5Y1_9ACTN|nr:DUF4142 domain-containing protein [Nonomuraea spiralis]GGS63253.1 hypothetical protein GCM10010176_001790 [Nonomuraea spiralis]